MDGRKKGFSSVWEDAKQIDELLPATADGGFQGIEPTFTPGAIPSPQAYRREAGAQGPIRVEPNWYRYAPKRLPARLSADLDAILSLQ